jgi:hypothetical protein
MVHMPAVKSCFILVLVVYVPCREIGFHSTASRFYGFFGDATTGSELINISVGASLTFPCQNQLCVMHYEDLCVLLDGQQVLHNDCHR